jgi:hypothetical protein
MGLTLGYFKRRTGDAARWQQAAMQLLHREKRDELASLHVSSENTSC